MRTEAEVRAARDNCRRMVRHIEAAGLCEYTESAVALAALSWVLGDDPDESARFDHGLALTAGAVREFDAEDRAEAEQN